MCNGELGFDEVKRCEIEIEIGGRDEALVILRYHLHLRIVRSMARFYF